MKEGQWGAGQTHAVQIQRLCGCAKLAFPFRLVDGDINISQSNAILRHIARKFNMYGSTEADHCRVDEVLDGIQALRGKYAELVYIKSLVRTAKFMLTARYHEAVLPDFTWFVSDGLGGCVCILACSTLEPSQRL